MKVTKIAGKSSFCAVKKPIPVDVVFATKSEKIDTKEGEASCEKGDAILTGVQGERWPIKRESFEKTYEPVGKVSMGEAGKYSKKPIKVKVEKMSEPFHVTLSWNKSVLSGKAGDYKVEYGPDDFGVVDAEIFSKTYDIVPC